MSFGGWCPHFRKEYVWHQETAHMKSQSQWVEELIWRWATPKQVPLPASLHQHLNCSASSLSSALPLPGNPCFSVQFHRCQPSHFHMTTDFSGCLWTVWSHCCSKVPWDIRTSSPLVLEVFSSDLEGWSPHNWGLTIVNTKLISNGDSWQWVIKSSINDGKFVIALEF